MEWSTQHPCWTTRNRTQVQGGKRDPTHKRVIIWTRQQKGVSGLHMGKSIKSECVIQIHSRLQKHEQVLKFPTHINSAQSGSVTAHKWVDAAWGPAAVKGGGGGIIFSSLQWPWPADWAVPFSLGPSGSAVPAHMGPCSRESTLFMLCVWQSSVSTAAGGQSVQRSCELLPTWSLIFDFCSQKSHHGQRKLSSCGSMGVPVLAGPCSSTVRALMTFCSSGKSALKWHLSLGPVGLQGSFSCEFWPFENPTTDTYTLLISPTLSQQ